MDINFWYLQNIHINWREKVTKLKGQQIENLYKNWDRNLKYTTLNRKVDVACFMVKIVIYAICHNPTSGAKVSVPIPSPSPVSHVL